MRRLIGLAVSVCAVLPILARSAFAEPYYYYVEADTTAFEGEEFDLELNIARDFAAGGPTDNTAEILSFAAYDTDSFGLIDYAGTASGDFQTGIILNDSANGGIGRQNYTGTFGSQFSYVVGLSGSQIELQTPLEEGGFMGHSLYLAQNSVGIMPNPAGFGASVEIYRDGPPDPVNSMEVSTHEDILVRLITDGFRPSNPTNNYTWSGGSGLFSDPAHWNIGVPKITSATASIRDTSIDGGAGTPVTVTLDRGATSRGLILTAEDTLDLAGHPLTLSGRITNNGTLQVDGEITLLFNSTIEGTGTTHLEVPIIGKGNLTIAAGHTLDGSSQGGVFGAGTLTNNGLITGFNQFMPLAANSIINNGTILMESAQVRLKTPTVVNNGLIKSTNAGAAITFNPDGLPMQTITGPGDWDIGNGANFGGPIDFTTTGRFVLQPNTLFSAGSAALLTGSKISVPNLEGGAGGMFAFNGDTVTITNGDPSKPFDAPMSGPFQLIKNGSGTQILNGENNYTGGTIIDEGTLVLNNTALATTGLEVQVRDGGSLGGNGYIGTYAIVEEGGAIAPGSLGAGELTLFGLKMLPGSELNLELSSSGASDVVTINDSITYVGGTTVNILDLDIEIGETAWFFEYGNTLITDANGTPTGGIIDDSNFVLGDLPEGVHGHFVSEFSGGTGIVSGRIGFVRDLILTADFNDDGYVDGADLLSWQDGYGTGSTHLDGDADGDLDVDGRDFIIWQREFGSGTPPGVPSVTAVPEPSAIWLSLMTVVLLVARQRGIS